MKSISKKRGKPSKADIAEKSRKIQATSCSFEPFLVKEEVAPAPVPGPVVTSDNNLREPAWEDLLNLSSTVDENLIPSCFFDELSIFDPEKFGPDVFSSFWHEDD